MVGSVLDGAPTNVFDELEELKRILRPVEIAEAIGRRPETISRLRPGKPLSRRTEQRLDDLYALARKLSREVGEPEAVRFQLLRRREELGGRRLVDLVRAGEADAVLQRARSGIDDFDFEALDAELLEAERASEARPTAIPPREDPDRFLAANPDLEEPLALVAEAARAIDPAVAIDRQVVFYEDDDEPELFVALRWNAPLVDAIDRLRALYAEIGDQLAPFADRLGVGLG
jgi:hypothetical protein